MSHADSSPRYLPDEPLPPYAFVAPHWPRPPREPDPGPLAPLDPARWRASREYLRGVDLFNHGYYWEAHEAWEGLWHAAGRRGPVAELLKGLIKLAAAGVKARQRMPEGVKIHCKDAARHLRAVQAASPPGRFAGLDLEELARHADRAAGRPGAWLGDARRLVEVVFDWRICPA